MSLIVPTTHEKTEISAQNTVVISSKAVMRNPLALGLMVIFMGMALTACNPKGGAASNGSAIPLITSKSYSIELAQPKLCDADGCMVYDLKTVETNQPWINDYFLDRIKKTEPNAFVKNTAATVASQPVTQTDSNQDRNAQQSESMMAVRYMGQNEALATFELESYSYGAGAAHGLSHKEFVHFDLKQRKRIAVDQLLKPNVEKDLIQALYQYNQFWLEEHHIQKSELKLSDNYYYGINGVVFVYPLYELASYAEGMSELTLPYAEAARFIKAEYLPD